MLSPRASKRERDKMEMRGKIAREAENQERRLGLDEKETLLGEVGRNRTGLS